MASRVSPRSASDATRFTSTTPHAASKAAAAAPTPKPKQQQPSPQAKTPATKSPSTPKPSGGNRLPGETPEERVRRLRAAHEAARKAQTSSVDRVLGGSRRFFDVAHKATVIGLVGFTAIAGLVSIYSVYDMVTYNKQRRADFIEAQRKMEEDSLAAARLAFINGTATDAQVSLVEEANAAARESGTRLPPLLSAPTVTTQAEKIFGTGRAETASPEATNFSAPAEAVAAETHKKSSGWWPFASSAKPTTEAIQDKAKAAFEQERENQRRGGALDQIGLQPAEEKKKGWW
ncbi:hypothetical protein GCG54_00007139 [Colletotrichum gloeosporioides]|uniref:Cytochrome oxidase c assembly-domain-containing protein n=1 Tax=Colletotrichum gloeosporioides TaxID=474922 RepID=A0A8H4CN19_COLGL|nr:uncharacterized protein GCG54_00007139 [Colletotrichum gloeosporioides]KAF3806889.1 hypothetical protein GCG54_00007139 [Colletotrichum gloeosporioides]